MSFVVSCYFRFTVRKFIESRQKGAQLDSIELGAAWVDASAYDAELKQPSFLSVHLARSINALTLTHLLHVSNNNKMIYCHRSPFGEFSTRTSNTRTQLARYLSTKKVLSETLCHNWGVYSTNQVNNHYSNQSAWRWEYWAMVEFMFYLDTQRWRWWYRC